MVGVEFPVDSGGKSDLLGSVEKLEVGVTRVPEKASVHHRWVRWCCRFFRSDSGGVRPSPATVP